MNKKLKNLFNKINKNNPSPAEAGNLSEIPLPPGKPNSTNLDDPNPPGLSEASTSSTALSSEAGPSCSTRSSEDVIVTGLESLHLTGAVKRRLIVVDESSTNNTDLAMSVDTPPIDSKESLEFLPVFKNEAKRKFRDSMSLRPPLPGDQRLSVVPWNYPETILSDYQIWLIEFRIRELLLWAEGPTPDFDCWRFGQGAVHILCDSVQGFKWLYDKLQMKGFWSGCALKIIEEHELIRLSNAMLFVPGFCEEPLLILRLLETQNAGLSTENWRVHEVKMVSSNMSQINLHVDEESLQILRSIEFQPILGLGRVEMSLFHSDVDKPMQCD